MKTIVKVLVLVLVLGLALTVGTNSADKTIDNDVTYEELAFGSVLPSAVAEEAPPPCCGEPGGPGGS